MRSFKLNLTLLLLSFVLMSFISDTDANIRVKRAPPKDSYNFDGPQAVHENVDTKLYYNGSISGVDIQRDGAKAKKKGQIKIAETPECSTDVELFCADRIKSNNFLVLECLQDDEKTASKLSPACHHFLWTYKLNLTKDSKFEDASSQPCGEELRTITECQNLEKGEVIPCLIEHYNDIKSKQCSLFLNKVATIVFSDYRLMGFFINDCNEDISRFQCGRVAQLDGDEDDSPHSQGKTVACLREHRKELSKNCKKAIFKVAELQSDDFHLDRPLYYACKGDREYLCHDVAAGGGAVFKCLYKHVADVKLSDKCRVKLEERLQLIAEDVKVDKSFYDACKEDIEENECTVHGHRREGGLEEDLSRSTILLCLEDAQSEHKNLQPRCLQEIFDLRTELMEDYKISPELVSACEHEIANYCPLKKDDNVLHCLMKKITTLSRDEDSEEKFNSECVAEVTKLVQVANPGEDVRLDAPLMRACGDVVAQACSEYHYGQGDVITCLYENLDHEDMTDECEDELLVMQYFAAREFRLDVHLFKQCRNDAVKLCHSDGFNDPSTMKPDDGPRIFSCLHRHLRSNNPKDLKPSRPCIHEIKRVLRERAVKVNLMPEVEAACLKDLAEHCTEDNEHLKYGGEMDCLQSNLEDLSDKCRIVVTNYTIEVAEDIEIDRTLILHCTPMVRRFCNDLLDNDAMPNSVLDCLIEHKNDDHMERKCAATIEHHQILSQKDVRFSARFYDACKIYITKHCHAKNTKYDVVVCLSEIIRNDTIMENVPARIDSRCRHRLKFEILQRGETLELDPELKKSCDKDIRTFCPDIRKGGGEILECLRAHIDKLSNICHRDIFHREKVEAVFGDYSLLHTCKEMIKKYCSTVENDVELLKCLIDNKDQDDSFDTKCRKVVYQRQIEQTQDVELNPRLYKACRLDIPKFCEDVFKTRSSNTGGVEQSGVIDCLKKAYASKKKVLTPECKQEVEFLIRESAIDINLNPVLVKACKSDIKTFCKDLVASMKTDSDEDDYNILGSVGVMKCLMKNVNSLKDRDCKEEVANVILETRVDVHLDPMLLAACQQDLIVHCKDVHLGQGQKMSCLLSQVKNHPNNLKEPCREALQERMSLWDLAAEVAPLETFSEIYDQMSSSTARNYLFAVSFVVIGIIFIVGLTCGRVTKRVRAEVKNK